MTIECGKCDFKTEYQKEMENHLSEKHKRYLNINLKEHPYPQVTKYFEDLDFYEKEELQKKGKKIIECSLCHNSHYALLEPLTGEEVKEVLSIKREVAKIFEPTKGMFWNDKSGEKKWACPQCAQDKDNQLIIKYWDIVENIKDIQNKIMNERTKKRNNINNCGFVKKAKLKIKSLEWDEGGLSINFPLKNKLFEVEVDWDSCVTWLGGVDAKKFMTAAKKTQLEELAQKIFEYIKKEGAKIENKYYSEALIFPVSYDEGITTFRKHIKDYGKNQIILITINDWPDECDDNSYIQEIVKQESTNFGDWFIECYLTHEGQVQEYVWKIKDKKENGRFPLNNLIDRRAAFKDWRTIKETQECLSNVRKILTGEETEADVEYCCNEFKIFREDINLSQKEKIDKIIGGYSTPKRLESFSFQSRAHHGKPWSGIRELEFWHVRGLINIYKKKLEWLKPETHTETHTCSSKITKTGTHSRHVVLDKATGLGIFTQGDCSDLDVEVSYEHGRIIIIKK